MVKVALFLSIGVLVLLIIISLLVPQLSAAKAEVSEAREFSGTVKQLLRAIDVRCTARSTDYSAMEECIAPVLIQNDFSTDIFRTFDERRAEPGVFVIKNEGSRTYNGSAFVLVKNGEELTRGCHINSSILTEYTCRFSLEAPCIEGDVYEIRYGEASSRLVTKTC